MRDFEHYNLMILESHSKIYYANSNGKVGYVVKGELAKNGNRMNESLIHWIKPKERSRKWGVILTVCIGEEKHTLKKLIAQTFLNGYDHRKHYVHQIDGNYKNCSLTNLRLIDKLPLQRDTAIKGHSKPISVKKDDWQDYKAFPSIRTAAVYLHVYHRTLSNLLYGRYKDTCLVGYTFIFEGRIIQRNSG